MGSFFLRSWLHLGVASTVLGACGPTESPKRVEPPADIPAVVDVMTLALPLDSYLPEAANAPTVKRAEQVLFQRCMARFGWVLQLPPAPTPKPFKPNERRYGVTADRAKQHGYHTPEVDARSSADMASEPKLSEEAFAEIQTSVSDAQCKTETRLVEIWAGVEAAYQTVAIEANFAALQAIAEWESARSRNAAQILQVS